MEKSNKSRLIKKTAKVIDDWLQNQEKEKVKKFIAEYKAAAGEIPLDKELKFDFLNSQWVAKAIRIACGEEKI